MYSKILNCYSSNQTIFLKVVELAFNTIEMFVPSFFANHCTYVCVPLEDIESFKLFEFCGNSSRMGVSKTTSQKKTFWNR